MSSAVLYVINTAALFVFYVLTARIGLSIGAVSGFATLVWFPTGISLAFLFLFGLSLWPAVFVGAFVANILTGAPYVVALGIAVGNTLEAVIAVYCLKRFAGERFSFDSVAYVVKFLLFAVLLSTIISATIGVASLWLSGIISYEEISSTWSAWWIGDMISDLVVAPFVLVWWGKPLVRFHWREGVEAGILAGTLIGIGYIVFFGITGNEAVPPPITYLVFPPLIWASLRFGPASAITAVFFFCAFAVLSTVAGHGPFAIGTVSENLLYLQSFMTVIAVTTILLAAAVTERKLQEKKKDEFISIASHELKTPVTSMKAYAEIMEMKIRQEKNRLLLPHVSKLTGQVRRLSDYVSLLLDITRIQEGTMEITKEHYDVTQQIQNVIREMNDLSKHNIVFPGKKRIEIVADRKRVRQVIYNLISNAIKYSPERKKILIAMENTSDSIIFSVQDFGVGIPPKERAFIFDKFYRAKNTVRHSDESLGLGLFLTKQIVERHGGRIWVDSEEGKGSTFFVKLPKWEIGARS